MGVFRWAMNWVSGVIAIIALTSIVTGILLVNDIAEFRTQFYQRGSVLFLDIDHRVESGFIVDNAQGNEAEFEPVPLTRLYDITDFYIDEKYDQMLEGTSKVFIFEEEAFEGAQFARVGDIKLDKDSVITLLKSHQILDIFENETGYTVEETFGAGLNRDDVRWRLFARLVFTQVEDEGPMFLLHGMRNGHIDAHPQTITFLLFPMIPEPVFDWLAAPERVARVTEDL